MKLSFTKMHGLGNDFMVIDNISQHVRLSASQIQAFSNRRTGIGFDQMLVVEPPMRPDTDFFYRIFNADGTEVGQCGNGARCLARFVRDAGLTHKQRISVETKTGLLRLRHSEGNQVTVDMGRPKFDPKEIPFKANKEGKVYTVHLEGEEHKLSCVSLGNPHGVMVVDNVRQAPVKQLGKKLAYSRYFPEGANIGFMEIESKDSIKLRVYERGAGETAACGSGACAAVVIGRLRGLLSENVLVNLPGGVLNIRWNKPGSSVLMTGPAEFVYEGRLTL